MTTAIMIIQVICAVALIVSISLQSSDAGLSSSYMGGSDTFLGAGKSKTTEAKLVEATKWVAGVFLLLTLVLNLL